MEQKVKRCGVATTCSYLKLSEGVTPSLVLCLASPGNEVCWFEFVIMFRSLLRHLSETVVCYIISSRCDTVMPSLMQLVEVTGAVLCSVSRYIITQEHSTGEIQLPTV